MAQRLEKQGRDIPRRKVDDDALVIFAGVNKALVMCAGGNDQQRLGLELVLPRADLKASTPAQEIQELIVYMKVIAKHTAFLYRVIVQHPLKGIAVEFVDKQYRNFLHPLSQSMHSVP